ncbi:MAG: phosphate/phosphite/phosphonate ABC transporter substrate-binding protein [Xanthomonadales bacterium]|jgi:phosphonate transport system substrate-binding protein|nr:phosphate/phosphite/phosphonate ABC transporter substrate-binding protein [Xanthomonadales bacterium]
MRALAHFPTAGVIVLLAVLHTLLAATANANQTVLVVGRVSDDPKAHHARMQPLVDYVAARMGDLGIREGRVLMARDAQQMVSYLRQGKVDWITETSATALAFEERAGAQPLVRAVRGGFERYRSVIFVRSDSGIDGLMQLQGRVIAFQNPLSTSAYFLPAADLLGAGLRMAIQASPLERPPSQFVGYAFAQSEGNQLTWVRKGLVDAAAFSDQDWQELVAGNPALAGELAIIHRSAEFPRALELVRPGMPAVLKTRLRELLLAAHRDPAAAPALRAYQRTERFADIDDESARMLDLLRLGVRRVRAGIE